MQYLLSEDEMAAIRREREALRKIPCHAELVEGLANVCKMVATTMIPTKASAFQRPFADGSYPTYTNPHGCIHAKGEEDGWEKRARYCSGCPVQGICPLPKEWSK